jgi:hypothetical protein
MQRVTPKRAIIAAGLPMLFTPLVLFVAARLPGGEAGWWVFVFAISSLYALGWRLFLYLERRNEDVRGPDT